MKRSFIPWGLRVSKARISRVSLALRHSLPPLMTEKPNTTKLEVEWLEELKWRETGLDRSFLRMRRDL